MARRAGEELGAVAAHEATTDAAWVAAVACEEGRDELFDPGVTLSVEGPRERWGARIDPSRAHRLAVLIERALAADGVDVHVGGVAGYAPAAWDVAVAGEAPHGAAPRRVRLVLGTGYSAYRVLHLAEESGRRLAQLLAWAARRAEGDRPAIAAPAPAPDDLVGGLVGLADLRASGALSGEEFVAAKELLLRAARP